ncbi:ascomycete fungal laccase from thielavia arenaria [Pseudomassariella vexata]|uniref:laccase n=1 Tax=Pseudomassariella vexata TaxID=1141098 RepID=A0A1Y2DQS5_9PEZI|nr:ascomycete fungal laccase from thielavia arenaria [Pseudomassariella vexata]ORY61466.1 ascomycete fungal laccase from thielavia arenaria [Pseudomassariella vexata]
MRSFLSLTGLLPGLLFAGLASAAPGTQELAARAPGSCNTASNRACWTDCFDIYTDYEEDTPPGTTVPYEFEITEQDNWLGPDGVVKTKVMLVNDQYPGPTIVANWGDTISVKVTNKLRTNGTSIHWHGIRQLNNNINDGANGVTECPLAPGKSKTYTFRATQYGTTWYHSHFSAQYGNGVFGSIQINGPASLPYDIDLGPFPIFDVYRRTADELVEHTMHPSLPPPSDNIFINGTNIDPLNPSQGKYANVTLTPGKRHRLRLINPSVDNNFQVSLVGHQMTVIAADMVPVDAFTTDSLFMAVGQRYDVTIDASQKAANYWFNVTISGGGTVCGDTKNTEAAGVFHYAGAPGGLPTNPGTKPIDALCVDNLDLSPVVPRDVDLVGFTPCIHNNLSAGLDFHGTGPTGSHPRPTVTWTVNGNAMNVDWDRPVLEYILEGNTSYPRQDNIIVIDEKDTWTYWLVQNLARAAHPMHLHGHDFVVLGRSNAKSASANHTHFFKTEDIRSLKKTNPIRRDVTMLPANGWVVIAFKTDNPGNWLMHCHIAWHVSGGLAVDFVERRDEQEALISAADKAAYEQTCSDWRDLHVSKIDSGL